MATKKSTTKRAAAPASGSLSEGEKAALQERIQELKAESRRGGKDADGEADLLAKVAEMEGADRAMAERIHALVKEHAPGLASRTWYGMPAWTRDGKVVCFFKSAGKFKSRYATLGFEEQARLDEGTMWPTSYALTDMTAEDEERIAALIRQAAG